MWKSTLEGTLPLGLELTMFLSSSPNYQGERGHGDLRSIERMGSALAGGRRPLDGGPRRGGLRVTMNSSWGLRNLTSFGASHCETQQGESEDKGAWMVQGSEQAREWMERGEQTD